MRAGGEAPLASRILSFTSLVLFAVSISGPAAAQLADSTQITPTMPGGYIAKSLEQQVGAGHGDELTPGSSVYLIKRDPARSIRRGRQIFQRKFTAAQGVGPRVSLDSTGNIREARALGAGLSDSCAGCHGRPRGAAARSFSESSASFRDSGRAPTMAWEQASKATARSARAWRTRVRPAMAGRAVRPVTAVTW